MGKQRAVTQKHKKNMDNDGKNGMRPKTKNLTEWKLRILSNKQLGIKGSGDFVPKQEQPFT